MSASEARVDGEESAALRELRAEFPALERWHFFNYAATAPISKLTADAVTTVVREGTEPLSEHFERWLRRLEAARGDLARLVNASPKEIAFTTSTSAALSLIAAAIPWREGERVLYPRDEFPSNRYVWQNLAGHGVSVEEIEIPEGGSFLSVLERTSVNRVRAVSVSSAAYRDGRLEDIRALSEWCHARGILVVVDAIQSIGAHPVDVRAWQCDFLACGGQKWLLSPVGTGFLFVRGERLGEIRAPVAGWASTENPLDFGADRYRPSASARRFEPGLLDVGAIAGLHAGVDQLGRVGWDSIYEGIRSRGIRVAEIAKATGFRLTPAVRDLVHPGIVTLSIENEEEAERVERSFSGVRMLATHRDRAVRLSVHALTTDRDLQVLERTLAACRKKRTDTAPVPGAPETERRSQSAAPQGPETSRSKSARSWRRALITGATGGLGEALARRLAAEGTSLVLVARQESPLRTLSERITEELGVEALPVCVDLSEEGTVGEWLRRDVELLQTIDLLVLNAATAVAEEFVDGNDEDLRKCFEVNFFAATRITRAVLPTMLARSRGTILNVVTTGSRNAVPLFSTYSASKAALWSWGEALRREVGPRGVQVTQFIPPHMETGLYYRLGRGALAYLGGAEAGGDPSGSHATGWTHRLKRRLGLASAATETPSTAAEQAVVALRKRRELAAPLASRIQIALNAVVPGWMSKRIRSKMKLR